MATTDFLLRPAAQAPRAPVSAPSHAANQRGTAASAQSFSAVYEQQRSVKAQQQQAQQTQQRNDSVQQERQQQAARQTPAKTPTAPVKDKPAEAVKAPVEAKDTRTEPSENTADATQTPADKGSTVEQSGNVLPQETAQQAESTDAVKDAEDAEEEFLDPLLLMAMTSIPTEQVADATLKGVALDSGQFARQAGYVGSLGQTAHAKVNLESPAELAESEGLLTEEGGPALQIKSDKIDTSVTPEKAALLTSTSGKTAEVLLEKGPADKNNSAALLEAAKAAPDTLLNSKAVTPTDTIRADMQPRPESLLAAAQTRQVPGAAIAMQQSGWTQQVTDKVMWMSSQNLRSAEIKLDPAELGRLDIKIDMSQEHTQVTFTSANAGVRDSLEAQMHRLRELLAQQGMQDVDVNVSDQSQQQTDDQAQKLAQGRTGSGTGVDNGEEIQQHVMPLREQHDGRLGLVDYYA